MEKQLTEKRNYEAEKKDKSFKLQDPVVFIEDGVDAVLDVGFVLDVFTVHFNYNLNDFCEVKHVKVRILIRCMTNRQYIFVDFFMNQSINISLES